MTCDFKRHFSVILCLALVAAPTFGGPPGAKPKPAPKPASSSVPKPISFEEMQKRLESHIAVIDARRGAMEKLYGYPNIAEASLLEAFKRAGVKDLVDNPAHAWGGWFWMNWSQTGVRFYRFHQDELREAVEFAQNKTLKPGDMTRLDSGMVQWKIKEIELYREYANLLNNWARGQEFGERRRAEWDRLWMLLQPTAGDTTRAVQEAIAPMDKEGKRIEEEGQEITNRIVALANLKLFEMGKPGQIITNGSAPGAEATARP